MGAFGNLRFSGAMYMARGMTAICFALILMADCCGLVSTHKRENTDATLVTINRCRCEQSNLLLFGDKLFSLGHLTGDG